MTYLVLVLFTLALLVGFYVLTLYETRQGLRFLESRRARFDKRIEHVEFILEHVDFAAFFREELRRAASRTGHEVAHISLQAVRAVERLLTRLVKHLRMHHAVDIQPGENTREFVKTLTDFKDKLKETRPKAQDIHEG